MEHSTAGSEQYQRIIENLRQLPSLPSVATRLMEVVNSPYSSADDAANLIEKDPALTSTVLRMANSAFYGMPRSVSSVSSAVVILGFNTIRSIVLSASIMKAFPGKEKVPRFDRQKFWRHSILCALGAKLLAHRVTQPLALDPEGAFCAGILHDIGKLIFEQYVSDMFTRACSYAMSCKKPLVEIEKKVMGVTHAEIGRILSDKWALPIDLEQALVYHHTPEAAEQARELVVTVHCADIMAHRVGADIWQGEVINPLWDETFFVLPIKQNDYLECSKELKQNVDKSIEFLTMIHYAE